MSKVIYAGYLEAPSWGISRRKAQHEALILLETYERIQERRKQNGYLTTRKDIHKDFVLRGAVHCHACGKSLRSGWSKGEYRKYAYYLCQTKECSEYGKSIPRDKLEGEFASLLQRLQPSRNVFDMIKAMLKDAWEMQTAITINSAKAFKQDVLKVEKEINQLVERVMEATSPRVIAAYETRIDELEKKKLTLQEKAEKTVTPKHSFNEMLELSLLFLVNPYKLWASGRFNLQRTVLKLAFAGPIYYDIMTEISKLELHSKPCPTRLSIPF